jgi:hypothetical protein
MLPGVVLARRIHVANYGVRERDSYIDYLAVVRDAFRRRRADSS